MTSEHLSLYKYTQRKLTTTLKILNFNNFYKIYSNLNMCNTKTYVTMGILFQKRNVFIPIYANKGSAVSSYLESFFSWNECRIRFEGSAFSILASCCTDSQVLNSNYTKNLLRNVPNPQNWNGLLPPSRVKEIPRQPGPMVVPLSHCYLMRPPLYRYYYATLKK